MAWVTPNAPTEFICRRVLLPDTLIAAFNGAIGELGHLWNWEKLDGLSESEAASLGFNIFDSFSDCEMDKRMIGSIQHYAGLLPVGVLPCDGGTYNQIDYPDLYTSLGGVGITFDVPDLRGKFLLGADLTYPVGSVGGAVDHSLTVAELPSHEHLSHNHDVNVDIEPPVGAPDVGAGLALPAGTGLTGGGLAHNNMPPYHALEIGIVALPVLAGGGVGVEVGLIADEKSAGVQGGTCSAGSWQTRELNTVRVGASWLSLGVNEFTLSIGEYLVMVSAPVRNVGTHRAQIKRLSDSLIMPGQSTQSHSTGIVRAVLSVASSETYIVEHRSTGSNGGNGFGEALGIGVETYTQVMVVKYA